eukprot:symbB.v1.2.013875.t1/scaffold991.1/size149480/10
MLYIRMCDSIIREAPLHVFTDFFMRPLLWLSLDKVKNVRLCWATVILPHLRKVGRLGHQRMVLAAAVRLRSTLDREVHRILEEAKLPEVSEAEIAALPDPETDHDDSDGGDVTGQEGETGSSSECGNVREVLDVSEERDEVNKAEDATDEREVSQASSAAMPKRKQGAVEAAAAVESIDPVMRAKQRMKELAMKVGLEGRDLKPYVNRIDSAITEAWQKNRDAKLRGQVDCGQVRRGTKDPCAPGFLSVGVSKNRGNLGQSLSPFLLFTPKELQAFATDTGLADGVLLPHRPLELVWQAAKVKQSEIGADGLPMDVYFQRRAAIYKKGDAQRRYIDTKEIGGAVLSWRTQRPVQYIESRKFYCCAYSKAVVKTQFYQFLESLCSDGLNLLLLGPDGHPCLERDRCMEEMEIKQALSDAYKDPSKQFGHERVLLAMLSKEFPWKDADAPALPLPPRPVPQALKPNSPLQGPSLPPVLRNNSPSTPPGHDAVEDGLVQQQEIEKELDETFSDRRLLVEAEAMDPTSLGIERRDKEEVDLGGYLEPVQASLLPEAAVED